MWQVSVACVILVFLFSLILGMGVFLQDVIIACCAEPCISYGRVVRMSVRLSHAGTESKTTQARITKSSPKDSSLGIKKFIQKFERVHP